MTPKNVAAVLTAAAFEDILRRMGELFAGVSGRPKLEDVLNAIKDAGLLPEAQVRIAHTGLAFRNDALHADWIKIDRNSVQQYLGLVEGWLSERFR
ncbi:MAG TPA: hypothetical protein VKM54_20355 [Myxococcota bacterium]|nr:hypothetical protein [Myxococcota bacterium]